VTWIGAAMDIDDRRRADAELRLLAQAMACVRDYIMILRVDPLSPAENTIIFANQAVIDRTGYARDELVEHPYSQLLGDGSDVPAMLTRLRAAMLERRQIRIEMAQVARDKSIFWIDADVIPMFDAFDNFTHVVAVGRDITARKAADEEVFHSSPGLN
jgi:PAS domain S-box-containing protein